MYDVGVHLLDLIQYVSGRRFVEVAAFTHPDRRRKLPDDTMTVLGRLEGDCHALAKATREVGSAENNLIIEGEQATLITSPLRCTESGPPTSTKRKVLPSAFQKSGSPSTCR